MAAQVIREPSLYQQLGGREPIAAVVDDFSRRLLADAELEPFFAGRDLEGLRRHQAAFLAFALGGPNGYRGQSLRRAHAGLGISDHHFRLVAGHLVDALGACGVPGPQIAAVVGHMTALQGDVVED